MAKPISSRKPSQGQQRLILYAVALVGLVVIIGFIVYTILNTPPEVPQARLDLQPAFGGEDARVKVIQYGTYGCPSCRAAEQSGILQQVLETYGDDVQFVFRNFPVINPNDPRAAEAAQCALDQGNDVFWLYHEALFTVPLGDYGDYGEDEFASLAEEVGLDGNDLKTCLEKDTHKRTVAYWKAEAEDAGVTGIPVFFVNGKRINNIGQLDETIRQELGL
jgi:protein-disulfide isomerase